MRVAQVWSRPAVTLLQPALAGVVTCRGRSWLVVVAVPSWPRPFQPQHHKVPSPRMAQVW